MWNLFYWSINAADQRKWKVLSCGVGESFYASPRHPKGPTRVSSLKLAKQQDSLMLRCDGPFVRSLWRKFIYKDVISWYVFDDKQVRCAENIRYTASTASSWVLAKLFLNSCNICRWFTSPRTPTSILISVNNCSMSNKVILHVVDTWFRRHLIPGYLFGGQFYFMWSSRGIKKQGKGLQNFSSDIALSAAILIFSNTVCVAKPA